MFIYILKLENDKYYVGKTNNPDLRINDHFNNIGAEWTKLHKPLSVEKIIPNCDDYDEDKYTRIYMDKYGIDNVRGGSFVQIKLSDEIINILNKMKNGTNDNCFKCGKSGHFAENCDNIIEKNDDSISNNICFNCGKLGHLIKDCHKYDIIKNNTIENGEIKKINDIIKNSEIKKINDIIENSEIKKVDNIIENSEIKKIDNSPSGGGIFTFFGKIISLFFNPTQNTQNTQNTKVVDVKVAYIRPRFDNLKEWCTDSDNIYISNKEIVTIYNYGINMGKYPHEDSKWANPYKIPKDSSYTFRNSQLQKYKQYILEKIKEDPIKYNIEELRGKNLGCWCHPERCHGDILIEILNTHKE
jgi:cellular nucleic acid-binding protein